jgi:3-oxoacid CoA-transferase subunit A
VSIRFPGSHKRVLIEWAIVKAWRGDRLGNLQYRLTARNFNPLCAMAGRITVAEVEELVPPGAMAPSDVHTPGIYVHHVIVGKHEKRIERRTTRPNICG